MNTKYVRTTISLPEELLFETKKRALIEKKTIKEVVAESLREFLGRELTVKPYRKISDYFGIWKKGESGVKYVNRIRYGKAEKRREKYLESLWKKS